MEPETVESLKEKCRTLEAECHSLLNRAIKSEQQHVDAAAERDRAISAQNELRDEKSSLQKKLSEAKKENEDVMMNLAQLNETMGDRDIVSTMEQYKADAKRLNELRLTLESNFADLSVQYETLQAEHEIMTSEFKSKSRDLETTLEHVSNLEGNIRAVEAAAAQAESDREAAQKALEGVRKELAAEAKAHTKTKDDLKRSQNSLSDLRKELEGARDAAEKQRKEHEALKKKAQALKKQADLAQELEARNEQLVVQLAYQTKELADAKALITKLQSQLINMEEEEKKRRDNSINPKMVQYLKDQLAEAQERVKELRAKDKRSTDLIATLEAQVKRLKVELGRKNPSQLRLMEMEVQNELLIGMLQAASPHRQPAIAAKAGVPTTVKGNGASSATPPPRKLPPLETAQTQTSASPTPGNRSPAPAPIVVSKSSDSFVPQGKALSLQQTPRAATPTTPPAAATSKQQQQVPAAATTPQAPATASAAPEPAAAIASSESSSAAADGSAPTAADTAPAVAQPTVAAPAPAPSEAKKQEDDADDGDEEGEEYEEGEEGEEKDANEEEEEEEGEYEEEEAES